ncbi:MAG TPA: glycosyltransferase family 87 protein [Anaerolineales bacterium]|nr:glycosyltransferase family 87 protein [Anaerolineales bacterium]
MKRKFIFLFYSILLVTLLLIIAQFVPIPLDPYQDFQVLYRANKGIVNGIPLYDQAGQAQMVANDMGVSVDQVFVLPFPYPPWYALATVPLVLLPIDVAVRMWFLLNIAMLLASVWLLTDGWQPRKRLISFVAAILFLPILGALIVGQYVFPTILGTSFVIYALKHQHVVLIALGMALITFKPHIGIFILLAVVIYLLLRSDKFGRRAFWATLLTGTLLFAIGFIADQAWPITYLQSLLDFRNVSECEICISMPLTISRMIGLDYDQSVLVAGILLVISITLFVASSYRLGDEAFFTYFICVPLLVNPYLLNYDFSFVLIPLFYLAGNIESKLDWFWITLIFIIPWIGLMFGRGDNISLLISTLALFFIILTRLYKKHTITV